MGIIELNAIFVISLFDCLFNLVKVPVSVGNGLKKGRAVMIMCNLLFIRLHCGWYNNYVCTTAWKLLQLTCDCITSMRKKREEKINATQICALHPVLWQ